MKIVVNLPPAFYEDEVSQALLGKLNALGEVSRVSLHERDESLAAMAGADAVLMWSWPTVDTAAIQSLPSLSFLGQIDMHPPAAAALLDSNVNVSLARSAWAPAVAEMALTLTLVALRRVGLHDRRMHAGTEQWDSWPGLMSTAHPQERMLGEQTVGLVGFGGIGRRVRELLGPFSCEVCVADPFLDKADAATSNVRLLDLDDLVRQCSVVVLCASASGNDAILQAQHFDVMQDGAVLVNVSRGRLLEQDALVKHLEAGRLVAALDVFDPEPLPAEHVLRSLDNVVMTPHRAGGIRPSMRRVLRSLIEDLRRHVAGEPLLHPLTPRDAAMLDR